MKKIFAMLLALLMVFAIAACKPTVEPENPEVDPTQNVQDPVDPTEPPAPAETTLTVGTPAMNGDFLGGFGNSSYDLSIKTLLNGYMGTVVSTPGGEFVINPTVVESHTTEVDAAGNKTYTFTIHKDLLWSNGEPMTAKDFVFSILWGASPEWLKAGASDSSGDLLVGYSDYYRGYLVGANGLAVDANGVEVEVKQTETDAEGNSVTYSNIDPDSPTYDEAVYNSVAWCKEFTGLKLIDEYTFAMTIDAAELPYFYELALVAYGPSPMDYWAPGATIETGANGGAVLKCDNLLELCQNVANTERYAPQVVCGPYTFVSFENQIATLKVNEFFKGDYEGKKPQITYIIQKEINQTTQVDAVIAGDVDLITGVIEGPKIEQAKAAETVNTHSYLRNGYGLIAIACDFGPTADVNVRWALAYLIDRNEVLNYVLGGYGGIVHGPYGFAQWMYQEGGADLEARLTAFNLNVDKANEYLDKTDYKFESDGVTPFDATKATAGSEYYRYNSAGERLDIHHLGTTENEVTDIIEIQYTANAPLAGIAFDVTKSDFNALLDNYYYGYEMGDDRYYHTFNLASNFSAAYDPYYSWHSDFIGTWYNSCQLSDALLDDLCIKLRTCDSTDRAGYLQTWIDLTVRLHELMPNIPLYSNEYFDISYNTVQGCNTTPLADWYDIICNVTNNK